MNKRSRQRRQQQKAMNNIIQRGYSRKAAKAIYREYKQYSTSSVFQNAAKKFGYDSYAKAMNEGPLTFKNNGAYEVIKKYEEMLSKGLIGEDVLIYNHDDFDSNTFATALVNDLFEDMKNYITTATERAIERHEEIQSLLDSPNIITMPGWD